MLEPIAEDVARMRLRVHFRKIEASAQLKGLFRKNDHHDMVIGNNYQFIDMLFRFRAL